MLAVGENYSYEIQFFRAPWRKNDNRRPIHYLVLGIASSLYLLVAGVTLTSLQHAGAAREKIVLGLSSVYLGPLFLSLSMLMIIFILGLLTMYLVTLCRKLWYLRPSSRKVHLTTLNDHDETCSITTITSAKAIYSVD